MCFGKVHYFLNHSFLCWNSKILFSLHQSYPWMEESLLFIKYSSCCCQLSLLIYWGYSSKVWLITILCHQRQKNIQNGMENRFLYTGFYILQLHRVSMIAYLILSQTYENLFSILVIQKNQIYMWRFKAKYFQLKWTTFFQVNLDIYMKE